MTSHEKPAAEPSSPASSTAPVTPHRGLVLASALLAAGGMLVAGGYSLANDLLVLWALAIDAALAALAAGLCLNLCRLRRLAARAEQSAQAAVPAGGTRTAVSRWEREAAEEDDRAPDAWDVRHSLQLHYLFLALIPTGLLVLLAARGVWTSQLPAADAASSGTATALAVVSLAASCLWLVLARALASIPRGELPESAGLALAFRELQWASVLAALALLASLVWPPACVWTGRLMLSWLVVTGGEQLGHLLIAWLRRPQEGPITIPVLPQLIREAVFVHGNPLPAWFDAIERRFGVSFRSSWAIRFVRLSLVPALLAIALLFWGLSSLAVVRIDELGVRERFGRLDTAPLAPGLHTKLPWPFGRVLRYPVKRVVVKPIGFVSNPGRQTSYLWSKKHAQEEFALVLGDGSELVAIGCLVYYKIHEDRERFLDYVYGGQNPDDALEAYAYRALMEQTRDTTLSEVLTANRARFADRLEQTLQSYAHRNRLGIDVVDVALIGLHPPVDAAADYLDVISAQIDADRVRVEALGEKAVKLEQAQQETASAVAAARVDAAQRIGKASGESSQFVAIGEAYALAAEAFQWRLWFEAFEDVLGQKRFVLVDQAVATGEGGILLDQRGKGTADDPVPLTRDAGLAPSSRSKN
jgi:regulator of protease activity HflC (stomatin/prohibitin superfamily)